MPRAVYEEQPVFSTRAEAGRQLAERLTQYTRSDSVALAVPRGGVPVALEVAQALDLPLDFTLPRKISVPYDPGSGYGAVTDDGTIFLNQPLVKQLELTDEQVQQQVSELRREIARRSALYRQLLPSLSLEGKTAILVDDGLASGFTMVAAVKSLRLRKVAQIVVAVPVATGTAYDLLKPQVDRLVCLVIARVYGAVIPNFYREQYKLPDEEIIRSIKQWQEKK